MSYRLLIDPAVRLELLESTKWYNQQQPGLGRKFYDDIFHTLNFISKNPLAFQICYKSFRQAPMKTFPFIVLYIVNDRSKTVAISAIFHTSRNPQIWKNKK